MYEKSRITLLALGPMLLIPLMVVLISFVVINEEKHKLDNSLSSMEQEAIDNLKLTMESRVNSAVDLIVYRNSVIKAELHKRIQQRVSDAHKIADKLYRTYSSRIPQAEVKSMIVEALRPLTWNDGESFIFILDFDGVFQLAPAYLRHLEGSSIIDFKDATGREVIKEEIEISIKQGHGFLWDTFTKPNGHSDEQYEQLAYVKNMGFYNWYMGSAEYLDTATKASDARLLSEISHFRKQQSDYFFIINTEGTLLLNHARPELLGQNFGTIDEPALNALFAQVTEAIQSQPDGAVIEYQFFNPNVNKVEDKIGFLRKVPGSDWIIGSGFHPADVQREIAPKIARSSKANQMEIQNLQTVAIWSFVVSVAVSVLLAVFVYRMLWTYKERVADKHRELDHLSNTFEEKVLDRTKALVEENDELEMLAQTDPLTNIRNRLCFNKEVEALAVKSQQTGEVFSLMLFDIDHFKLVNDQYGHDVGDQVLVEQARLIEKNIRGNDIFCRYGGEEFVIVLPNTDLDAAMTIAEKLRRLIESASFTEAGTLTISAGVGAYRAGQSIKELIKEVDKALYEAKRTGRNQVIRAKG